MGPQPHLSHFFCLVICETDADLLENARAKRMRSAIFYHRVSNAKRDPRNILQGQSMTIKSSLLEVRGFALPKVRPACRSQEVSLYSRNRPRMTWHTTLIELDQRPILDASRLFIHWEPECGGGSNQWICTDIPGATFRYLHQLQPPKLTASLQLLEYFPFGSQVPASFQVRTVSFQEGTIWYDVQLSDQRVDIPRTWGIIKALPAAELVSGGREFALELGKMWKYQPVPPVPRFPHRNKNKNTLRNIEIFKNHPIPSVHPFYHPSVLLTVGANSRRTPNFLDPNSKLSRLITAAGTDFHFAFISWRNWHAAGITAANSRDPTGPNWIKRKSSRSINWRTSFFPSSSVIFSVYCFFTSFR